MPQTLVTIPMHYVLRVLSKARLDPLELDRFLSAVGIGPHHLDEKDARITADQCTALVRLVMERLDDEALGNFSRPFRRGSYALMARSAASAPTLEVAIRRTAHTFRLLQDDLSLGLVRAGDLVAVELRHQGPRGAVADVTHEIMVRVFWRLFAWLIGGRLPVVRFDFAFPPLREGDMPEPIFPGQKQFDCEQTAFWFAAGHLQAPVCRDGQALNEFIGRSFAELLVPTRDGGVAGRVRRYLQNSQPAWPDLSQTAEALGMATSTLQRQLAIEGISFQDLKNSLRRDLAIYRLHTSAVSLSRLAEELGFADNATFQRAFKQWTGSTPGAYRGKPSAKPGREG